MIYFYIHGFNGGLPSRSGAALSSLLGVDVICPTYDYSRPFADCVERLLAEIDAALAGSRARSACVMGASLGGFYALSLRRVYIKKIVAWNPVIYPATQLARFLGPNVRFNDGVPWTFERDALLSYARAPDPRVWDNFLLARVPSAPPERRIILGTRDEILDSGLAAAYWDGFAAVNFIDSGHSVEDYGHLPEIDGFFARKR